MHTTVMLYFVVVICACLSSANGYEQFTGRNFEKLRRGNCTKCAERLQMNVAEVLPRLTLIKQRILNALGRGVVNDAPRNDGPVVTFAPLDVMAKFNMPTTPKPQIRHGYRLNEIVSFPETTDEDHDDAVIKFRLHDNSYQGNEEAVGASLLLYVNRKRKMRKGGKGKKIVLEVSKLTNDKNKWESLTYLRTRVKKRRWKRISLPVGVAQAVLDSENRSLDLKVKCIGCGRLVQLVLKKNTKQKHKRKTDVNKDLSDTDDRRVKRRKTTIESRRNQSSSPILVISTRYRD